MTKPDRATLTFHYQLLFSKTSEMHVQKCLLYIKHDKSNWTFGGTFIEQTKLKDYTSDHCGGNKRGIKKQQSGVLRAYLKQKWLFSKSEPSYVTGQN